ncbi:MAG: peptide chain release factor N(5)-glutamine methyltransferase [Micropepsaceae bacterium]
MTTAAALIAKAATQLMLAGLETPQREARLLLAHVLEVEAAELALIPDRPVGPQEAARFAEAVERRAGHEPFAYITGRRDFWTLELEVSPATLIPRPDTETLVETALKIVGHVRAPVRILDLGTGTGAILLALLTELPRAEGVGVDVSDEALEIARRNALRAGAGDRARFSKSSWWSDVTGEFDLIVSNPPYIPSREIVELDADVRDFEPRLALDGGPDGLAAYRAILSVAGQRLSENGAVLFEVGAGQAGDVAAMMRASGLPYTATRRDLGGHERVVAGAAGPQVLVDIADFPVGRRTETD